MFVKAFAYFVPNTGILFSLWQRKRGLNVYDQSAFGLLFRFHTLCFTFIQNTNNYQQMHYHPFLYENDILRPKHFLCIPCLRLTIFFAVS